MTAVTARYRRPTASHTRPVRGAVLSMREPYPSNVALGIPIKRERKRDNGSERITAASTVGPLSPCTCSVYERTGSPVALLHAHNNHPVPGRASHALALTQSSSAKVGQPSQRAQDGIGTGNTGRRLLGFFIYGERENCYPSHW